MSDKKITVWIARYALTDGIIEATAPSEDVNSRWSFYAKANTTSKIWCQKDGLDWYRTKESAIARAEEMRSKKIAILQRQIAKLEAMRFE